jgi:hypothetical protein
MADEMIDDYIIMQALLGWSVGNEIGDSPGVMNMWKMPLHT